MQIRSFHAAAIAAIALVAAATVASAHVSIGSGPAFAGGRAVVTFPVGHGCEGADTYKLDVNIPPEITSVRGMLTPFGPADVVLDDAGAPTNVIWTKDDVRDADDQFYEVAVRIGVPETPFTVLYFATTQSCRDKDGMEYTTEWAALPGADPLEDGSEPPPAARLVIMPARAAGWNKYTVPAEITDLAMFFGDAQIVWSGDAAYSSNVTTAEMIEAEDGVETLTTIAADAEIWVKY